MKQIVVNVDPLQGGQGSVCSVARAPFDLADFHAVQIVDLDEVANLAGPDVVRQIGEKLAEKIRNNQTVDTVLTQALMQPGPPSIPICFRVGDPVAHALMWEALVGDGDFIALDERWPIARIARGGNVPDGAERVFAPPLRFVAVLSAVGRKAINEWESIYGAVKTARSAEFPIHLTLMAGEEEAVLDVAAAVDDAYLDVKPVAGTATELLMEIEATEPHIVHFFCHGTIVNRDRRLEIGTITDHDNDDGTSSVIMRVEELGEAAEAANCWVVTLNTCRGAEAIDEALTHAEELVNKGVPVAVGMRRLVEVDDAVTFSKAFYPEVFLAIKKAVDAAIDESRQIEWPDTLVKARRRLRDQHGADPSATDAWTLPVLYTRAGSFTVVLSDAPDTGGTTHDLGEAETYDGLFDVIADTAPDGLLDDLRILAPDDGGM